MSLVEGLHETCPACLAVALAKADVLKSSQLKEKSDFLTLWTKAKFYDKARFGSGICQEHQAD